MEIVEHFVESYWCMSFQLSCIFSQFSNLTFRSRENVASPVLFVDESEADVHDMISFFAIWRRCTPGKQAAVEHQ